MILLSKDEDGFSVPFKRPAFRNSRLLLSSPEMYLC